MRLRGVLPWSRVLYSGDVVVEGVVSAKWMLSRDCDGWRSGVTLGATPVLGGGSEAVAYGCRSRRR
jgi:hypothetical protein